MELGDIALRATGGPAPILRPQDQGVLPALGRVSGFSTFGTREYDATQVEYDARDRLRDFEQANAALRTAQRARDTAAVEKYRSGENLMKVKAWNRLSAQRQTLDEITEARRAAIRNTRITPEQRQRRIEALKDRADKISRSILRYELR
jgi:hypothetical protein